MINIFPKFKKLITPYTIACHCKHIPTDQNDVKTAKLFLFGIGLPYLTHAKPKNWPVKYFLIMLEP